MSWIALIIALEAGMVSGDAAVMDSEFDVYQIYEEPSMSTYFDVGIEVELFGFLFVGGGIENYQVPEEITKWQPHRAIYDFYGGVRRWGFELGVKHYCDHPVLSSERLENYIAGAQTKIYLKYEVTVGGKDG